MDEITISGEQPGPSLWKVSKDGHVMWVLGTLSPLPREITWRSRQVEEAIASSKEILVQESVQADIGFFRAIRLLPAALRARRNPDGARLKDVLPPELYARWSRLKAPYFDENDLETYRPMMAAMSLYYEALEKAGLTEKPIVLRTVRKLAKKHRVPVTAPRIKVELENPRQLLKDITETPRDMDIACFVSILDVVETELQQMKRRARAWAVGDVQALDRLHATPLRAESCLNVITNSPSLREQYAKAETLARAEWKANVERALSQNDVTFAVLSMASILSPDGRIAQMKAQGYVVEIPAFSDAAGQ